MTKWGGLVAALALLLVAFAAVIVLTWWVW